MLWTLTLHCGDIHEILFWFQATRYQGRRVLLAFLVKEARKVTKGFQAPLCRDQVEEMGNRAPPGFPGPLDSQATRVSALGDHGMWRLV